MLILHSIVVNTDIGGKMVKFEELLETLGKAASVYLGKLISSAGLSDSDSVKEKWQVLHSSYFTDPVLSLDDQVRILEQVPGDMKEYRAIKRAAIAKPKESSGSLDEVAWYSINPTNTTLGKRLQFGLKNKGCQYWGADSDGVGCTSCGYFGGAAHGKDVTDANLVAQVRNILSQTKGEEYDVVELASDGNFFANTEVSEKARMEIFDLLAKQDNVKRILIESRPEYITEEKIRELASRLKPDQRLEIGIGLETTSDFIGHACINKGYGKKETETALGAIANVSKEFGNRVDALIYTLLKPAYLTEEQAIQDVVITGGAVARWEKDYGINVSTKIEPAVVYEGTILEVLHKEGRYTPPAYWSVVETIARLEKADAADTLRVGAREDMGDSTAIPANYHQSGMISQFDFIVYDSVQRYNSHRDIVKLLGDIDIAIQEDGSLEDWQELIGLTDPVFLDLYDKLEHDIGLYKKTDEFKEREKFYGVLCQALDFIEYNDGLQEATREKWRHDIENAGEEIERATQWACLEHLGSDVNANVRNIALVPGGLELLRMQLVIDYKSERHSVWLGIPTAEKVGLEDVQYVIN